MLTCRGFTGNSPTPCVYVNLITGVKVVAHVDDLLCEGKLVDLKWFREVLYKEVECKGEILGVGSGLSSSIRYLGRTIV